MITKLELSPKIDEMDTKKDLACHRGGERTYLVQFPTLARILNNKIGGTRPTEITYVWHVEKCHNNTTRALNPVS